MLIATDWRWTLELPTETILAAPWLSVKTLTLLHFSRSAQDNKNIINGFQLTKRRALTEVFSSEHTAGRHAIQGGRETTETDVASIRKNNRRRVRGRPKRIAVKRINVTVPES